MNRKTPQIHSNTPIKKHLQSNLNKVFNTSTEYNTPVKPKMTTNNDTAVLQPQLGTTNT